uniref:RNA-directed DNA polymerase n=1 Tax=Panagrolaimus davidi TaxID=227884 RepID=A0A914QUT5_9BILA
MSVDTFAMVSLAKIMPKYYGNPNDDFQEYCGVFQEKAAAFGMNADDCIKLFPACLEGRALKKFHKLPKVQNNTPRTWKQLLDDMALILARPQHTLTARDKLTLRNQRENESLEEFAEVIRNLVKQGFTDPEGYSDVIREKEETRHFVKGIANDKIKDKMFDLTFKDLEEAVAKAELYEEREERRKRDQLAKEISKNSKELGINYLSLRENQPGNNPGQKMFVNSSLGNQFTNQRQNDCQQQFNRPQNNYQPQGEQRMNTFRRYDNQPWNGNRVYQNQQQRYNNNQQTNYSRFQGTRNNYPPRTNFSGQTQTRQNFDDQNQSRSYPGNNNFANNNGNNFPRNNNQGRNFQPNNRGRGRSTGGYRINTIKEAERHPRTPSPIYYLTIVAIFALCFQTSAAQTFQFCPKNAASTMIEPPKPIECHIPEADHIKSVEVALYVKRRSPSLVKAHSCRAITTTQCVTSYMYALTKESAPANTTTEVSTKKCKELIKEADDEKLYQTQEKLNITTPFWGTFCDHVTNYEVQQGKVGLSADDTLLSDLSHLQGCDHEIPECQTTEGTIIWKKFSTADKCHYVYAGSYQGLLSWPASKKASDAYLVLEKLQAAFLFAQDDLTEEEKHCLPDKAMKMKNDAVINFIGNIQPSMTTKKQKREALKKVHKIKETSSTSATETLKQVHKINETSTTPATNSKLKHVRKLQNETTTTTTESTTTTNPPTASTTMKTTSSTTNTTKKPEATKQKTTYPTFRPTPTVFATTFIPPQETRPTLKMTVEPIRNTQSTQVQPTNEWTLVRDENKPTETPTKQYKPTAIVETVEYTTPKPIMEYTTRMPIMEYTTSKPKVTIQETTMKTTIATTIQTPKEKDSSLMLSNEETEKVDIQTEYNSEEKQEVETKNESDEEKSTEDSTKDDTSETEHLIKVFRDTDPKERGRRKQMEDTPHDPYENTDRRPTFKATAKTTTMPERFKSETEVKPSVSTVVDNSINSKLQYLEEEQRRTNNQNFATLWSQICNLHNKQIDVIKVLTILNPTAGVRTWFGRTDITAKYAGQVLEVKQCVPVVPETVHWDKKINETCFNQVPVIWNEKVFFAVDGTNDLTNEGEIVECSKQQVSVYKDEKGKWKSSKGTAHVVQMNHDINWHPENHPLQFDAPSVFKDDSTATSVQMLWSYSRRINNQDVKLKNENIRVNTNWLEKAANALAETGDKIATNIKDKVSTSWWQDIKDIIADIKLIMIMAFTLIGLIVVVVYFYPWLQPCCKRCLRARNRQIEQTIPLQVNTVELKESVRYIPPVYNIRCLNTALPHITASVNDVSCTALIDSGSAITFISEKMATDLNVELIQTERCGKAANGESVDFLGTCIVKIQCGNQEITQSVYVAKQEHSPAALLMGYDLCKAFGFTMDFKTQQIHLLNTAIPIFALMEDEVQHPIRPQAIVTEPTIIKKGDNFLFGYTTSNLKKGSLWLTSQAKSFQTMGLIVGSTLMKANGNLKVPLRIMNTTNMDIELYPGTVIADLENIQEGIQVSTSRKPHETYPINAVLDGDEYVPEEADISKDLPNFPEENISKEDFLMKNLDLSRSILSENGKERLCQIILDHQEAFVGPDGIIGNYTGPIVHRIDLVDSTKFIAERPRRIAPALQEVVEKQIDDMLKQHIIRPSTSPFQSPIVMVKKADKKSWRMAIDYRRLNAETKKQANFLPLITDIIDKVAGKTIYSTFDLQSGFHQIKVREQDIEKTAFVVTSGVYEFVRMPFGLTAAPATFQKVMDNMKREVQAAIFCYLDDIVTPSENEEQHLLDIEEILTAIGRNGLKLRIDKCYFGMEEIKYLGFLISKEGIRPDPANIEKVKNFTRPTSLTQVRSFIGATSYFRRFIPCFAKIMSPLYDLTTKGENVKENWKEEHETAFKTVIQKLVEAPVLAPPKFGRQFEIETDASKEAFAACLLQRDDNGQLHPISYFSRKMNKHERNYSSIELEALGVVAGLKEFRPYIEGSGTTIIRTDSSGVCSLMKNKNLQGRLAKFQLAIQAFDITFTHRAGAENKFCDYMSRYPVNAITLRSGKTVASAISLTTMIEEQKKQYPEIMNAFLHDKFPQKAEQKQELQKQMQNLIMKNRCIYYYNEEESDDYRVLVPYTLRKKVIDEFHADALQGGHLGQQKTLEKLKKRVYWPSMVTDIKEMIKSCEICQKSKVNPGNRNYEPLQPIEPPTRPFDRVHVDICGPLPKAAENEQYILVTVDAFSKWLIASPMKNQTARTVATTFINDVITKHGCPNTVVTDCGRQFTGTIFSEMAQIFGFQHNTSTPYHQEANGEVERQNRTLATMLRGSVALGGDDWPETLQMATFAFNTSVQSSTH